MKTLEVKTDWIQQTLFPHEQPVNALIAGPTGRGKSFFIEYALVFCPVPYLVVGEQEDGQACCNLLSDVPSDYPSVFVLDECDQRIRENDSLNLKVYDRLHREPSIAIPPALWVVSQKGSSQLVPTKGVQIYFGEHGVIKASALGYRFLNNPYNMFVIPVEGTPFCGAALTTDREETA